MQTFLIVVLALAGVAVIVALFTGPKGRVKEKEQARHPAQKPDIQTMHVTLPSGAWLPAEWGASEMAADLDVGQHTQEMLEDRAYLETLDDDELEELRMEEEAYLEELEEEARAVLAMEMAVAQKAEKAKKADTKHEDLLQAIAANYPELDPLATSRMLSQLEAVETATRDEGIEVDAPVLIYGDRRYVHFEPGSAYLVSKKMQKVIDDCAFRSQMPPALVVGSAVMFYNRWYKAMEENRIRPLMDAFGNPVGEYLIVNINKEPEVKTMAELWQPSNEDKEAFARATERVEMRTLLN